MLGKRADSSSGVRPFLCNPPNLGDTFSFMHSEDDIHYALETAKVLREPDRRIDTFGETRFEFQLISELMDRSGEVRIRTGEFEAMRPRILRPASYNEVALEGFDPSARARFDKLVAKLKSEGKNLAFLQYGFQLKCGQVHEEVVHDNIDAVRERVLEDIRRTGNPARAIIEGVDDAWEICILKFFLEMVLRSHEINSFDFKRRGLI